MGKTFSLHGEDGRLPPGLAGTLDRRLQDGLGHPIRREVLRALHRPMRSRGGVDIQAELHVFGSSQINYHLEVLGRSGIVVPISGSAGAGPARTLHASEIADNGKVRAILRATEQRDRERREAADAASASPLLTMFRVPRPVRTIRLRGRSGIDAERER